MLTEVAMFDMSRFPVIYHFFKERLYETNILLIGLSLIFPDTMALAGLYSGPTDTTNSIDPAIPSTSTRFVEWANAIDPARTHFAPRGSTTISATGYNSLGDLDATEIANGVSPGYLTVTFPKSICNGSGADFAVFENGFTYGSPNGLFMELAYVEVSSNGSDFARFPSISTNTAPVAGSGSFPATTRQMSITLPGKTPPAMARRSICQTCCRMQACSAVPSILARSNTSSWWTFPATDRFWTVRATQFWTIG